VNIGEPHRLDSSAKHTFETAMPFGQFIIVFNNSLIIPPNMIMVIIVI